MPKGNGCCSSNVETDVVDPQKKDMELQENKITALQEKVKQLELEKQKAEEAAKLANDKAHQLTQEHEQLKKTCQDTSNSLQLVRQDSISSKQQLEEKMKVTEKQKLEAEKNAQTATAKVRQLEQAHTQLKKEHEDQVVQVKQEIEQTSLANEKLKNEIQEYTETIAALTDFRNENQENTSESDELQKRLSKLQLELDALQQSNGDLSQENQKQKKMITALGQSLRKLSTDNVDPNIQEKEKEKVRKIVSNLKKKKEDSVANSGSVSAENNNRTRYQIN